MSDHTVEPLDLSATIARIDRDIAEQDKLREESQKFIAEQRKLIAEAYGPTRDRWLAPAEALALTYLVGVVGLVSFLAGLVTGFNLWHR
jgi:hypothetical protein